MENLEPEIRNMLLHIMKILVLASIGAATLFFLFYLITHSLSMDVRTYTLKRLILPFSINLLSYLTAKRFNCSERFSDHQKNVYCSFTLCTLAGSTAIFYSFFTPLWCCPAAAVMFCMIFHDKTLLRKLFIYNFILVSCALLWISSEQPNEIFKYSQHAVIVFVLTILFYITGTVLLNHQEKIINQTKEIYQRQLEYEQQLQFDALTGVYSRRYMMKKATQHMEHCDSNHPVSVAIIDIDNFKRVNDTYGHEMGDIVLERLGSILRPYIRDNLTIGRFGGEEFVFIFEGMEIAEYQKTLETIRETFGGEHYDFCDHPITISGGFVSCYCKDSFDNVLEIADQGLYYSKRNGKNQITIQKKILQ